MTLNSVVKENWQKLQEKFNYPVDELGRPIEDKDTKKLYEWKSEGIDRFLKN